MPLHTRLDSLQSLLHPSLRPCSRLCTDLSAFGRTRRRDRNGVEAFEHAYEDDLTDKKVNAFLWIRASLTTIRILNSGIPSRMLDY